MNNLINITEAHLKARNEIIHQNQHQAACHSSSIIHWQNSRWNDQVFGLVFVQVIQLLMVDTAMHSMVLLLVITNPN